MKHSGISQGRFNIQLYQQWFDTINYILFMKSTNGMIEKALNNTKV